MSYSTRRFCTPLLSIPVYSTYLKKWQIFPFHNKARLESIFHRKLTNDWNGKEEEARSVYAPNVERLIEVDVSCSDRRKVDVIVIVVIITVIISITDIRHRPIEFHSEI